MTRIVTDTYVLVTPEREERNRLLAQKLQVPAFKLIPPPFDDSPYCHLMHEGITVPFRWEDLLDGLLELRRLINGKDKEQ